MAGKNTILTREQVRDWEAQKVGLQKEVAPLLAKIAHLDKLLGAASLIERGTEPNDEAVNEPESQPTQGISLVDAIVAVIEKAGKALKPYEIRELLPTVGYNLEANPNYYYTAISRLQKRRKIVRLRNKSFALTKNKEAPEPDADNQPLFGAPFSKIE